MKSLKMIISDIIVILCRCFRHFALRTVTVLLFLICKPVIAQDIGVVQFDQPASGCTLTTAETVRILILNFGNTTITTPFTVSYSINGGTPVTETVNLPFIPPSTTYSYTFNNKANLSVPGTYTFTAFCSYGSDINKRNDTLKAYQVVNDPISNGGRVSASTSVCIGNNSGTLTLNAMKGNILNWEFSTDGGTSWTTINNTAASQSYSNLTVTTQYRAVVKSGVCPPANSVPAILNIDQPSLGGVLSGAKTVCAGSNSGTLILSGQAGTIQRWEYSVNGSTNWSTINATNTNFMFSNLTTSTTYRVIVKNGSCPPANSSEVTITVDPASAGGKIHSGDTVCSGANSDTLRLRGYAGSIVRWEYSANGGTNWLNISDTSDSYIYSNLTATTSYRAMVKSGTCPFAYSVPATVRIDPPTLGGVVSGGARSCHGQASGSMVLSGKTGNVLNWEYSSDGGITWTTINNQSTAQPYTNLTATTVYRALVQSGVCPSAYSLPDTVQIDSASVAGTLSGSSTECSGNNSGWLKLSGYTGKILSWEYSENGGLTWISIPNTTPEQDYNNLTVSTVYRVSVKSGVCPPVSSPNATISVLPLPLVYAGPDSTIRLGDTIILNGSGSPGIVNWSPPDGLSSTYALNPAAKPKVTTPYILTITDANGCSNSDTVVISIFGTIPVPKELYKKISNLMTPNGDGINDVWYIEDIENFPASEVYIYNIYGKEMFSASPYMNDWDGTYKGDKLPAGTYYYIVKFSNVDYVFKGSITMLYE